ncbi:hypothetical protein [Sphingobacterium kyonggiense]
MIISKKQILSIGLIATASLIFGSSCQQNGKTKETDSTTDSLPEKQVDSNITELKLDTAWKDLGDSLEVPEFAIKLEFSEKSKKLIKETQESVIISTYLLGVPADKNSSAYKNDGQLALASQDIELLQEDFAIVHGMKIAKADLDLLENRDFDVSVNVYSGRRSNPNNVLSGGYYDGKISSARGKVHNIKLELIEEAHPIN